MRVRHNVTQLGGDVEHAFMHEGPYVGEDMAGQWFAVRWDDGFRCAVPATAVTITEHDVLVELRFAGDDVPEGVDPDAWAEQLIRDALAEAGFVRPLPHDDEPAVEPVTPADALTAAVYRYIDDVDEVDAPTVIDIVRTALANWEPA